MKRSLQLVFAIIFLMVAAGNSFAQITSAASGNWSNAATWTGGVVPSSSSNITIAAGHTVTIDPAAAVCNNLTVNAAAVLKFRNDGTAAGITVNGNIVVNGNAAAKGVYGKFIVDSLSAPIAFTAHTLTLYGNLSTTAGADSSGCINFRMGSTYSTTNAALNTAQWCNVTFAGTSNSVITLQKTVYTPNFELFNGTVINKTGGAKVILSGGNLFQNTNSTIGSAYLIFQSGMVETGANNIWAVLVTAAAGLNTATSTMYVNGNLGRGITSSGGQRIFDVGDANAYRPIRIYPVAVPYVNQQYLVVRAIPGNANTGASTLTGGIDKISAVRYYKITYYQGRSTTTSFSYSYSYMYYGADDGVAVGNTNLRAAYSADNRATWIAQANASHTTAITAGGTTEFRTTALTASNPVLNDGQSMYLAFARATGTTENSLSGGTAVEKEEGLPSSYYLSQNYPNPFNPTTSISFSLPEAGFVTLKVYDVLGKEVANLLSEQKDAGNYKVNFDASKLCTGVYVYRLSTANSSISKKMMLIK
jgi:hypothetical protein